MADQNELPLITRIFFPRAVERRMKVINENKRFVHYTSANAAVGILRNAEVWMRKSTTMNDFSEIEHGLACVRTAYGSDVGKRFKALLNSLDQGLVERIERLFDSWLPHFRLETYLSCISEHEDEEDTTGRLSMWRAYGTVALVLNKDVFMSTSSALKAYTSPVAYLSPQSFERELDGVNDNIEANLGYLRSLDPGILTGSVFSMLRFAVLCTKHPGFREEREWRVIYSPTYERSDRISRSIEIVRGIPQAVCKIPLIDIPEEQLEGSCPTAWCS